MKSLLKTIAFISLLLPLSSHAKLVWTPENGWCAEGGILEPVIGRDLTVKDAQEAMDSAACEYEKGHVLPALRLYKKVYSKYPESKLAPEAMYQRGHIYLARCQYEDAFREFQKIIIQFPTYPRFNDVIETQFKLASDLKGGSRPYYWGVIPGFRDYDASIDYFESIINNAPYSPYAPMALMNIADLSQRHKKPDQSIDALDRLISNYRTSDLTPMAYIKLGEAYESLVPGPDYDQGSTLKAMNYYRDFLHLYPNNELACQAEANLIAAKDKYARSKLRIGDFYYKRRNNPCAAEIYYNEAISIAPDSKAACKAQKELELIANNIKPKKTIVDLIFGRYQPLSTPNYLDELEMAKRDTEIFDNDHHEFHLDEVQDELHEYSETGNATHIFDIPEDIEPSHQEILEKESIEIIEENWLLDAPCPLDPSSAS